MKFVTAFVILAVAIAAEAAPAKVLTYSAPLEYSAPSFYRSYPYSYTYKTAPALTKYVTYKEPTLIKTPEIYSGQHEPLTYAKYTYTDFAPSYTARYIAAPEAAYTAVHHAVPEIIEHEKLEKPLVESAAVSVEAV